MCGLAGILGTLNSHNRAALHRMTDALAHRGPDGAGLWESSPDSDDVGCCSVTVVSRSSTCPPLPISR